MKTDKLLLILFIFFVWNLKKKLLKNCFFEFGWSKLVDDTLINCWCILLDELLLGRTNPSCFRSQFQTESSAGVSDQFSRSKVLFVISAMHTHTYADRLHASVNEDKYAQHHKVAVWTKQRALVYVRNSVRPMFVILCVFTVSHSGSETKS